MDRLESFIRENKDQLDVPRKEDEGWEDIRKKLNSEKKTDWSVYWKVAAVLFFVSTMALTAMLLQSDAGEEPIAKAENTIENTGTVEGYYLNLISTKKSEYKKLANDEQSRELLRELENFDEAYQELKTSFKEINEEELAQAMIENLRLRVLILNEQIELIKNGQAQEETYYHSS